MVDFFSKSDSGIATMAPMGTGGTDTTTTSPNIFDLAVNSYDFDYPVFDEVNGYRVDVDVSDNDDETNIENHDKENAEDEPTVAQTPSREGENHPHSVGLQKGQRVSFQRRFRIGNQIFMRVNFLNIRKCFCIDFVLWIILLDSFKYIFLKFSECAYFIKWLAVAQL